MVDSFESVFVKVHVSHPLLKKVNLIEFPRALCFDVLIMQLSYYSLSRVKEEGCGKGGSFWEISRGAVKFK